MSVFVNQRELGSKTVALRAAVDRMAVEKISIGEAVEQLDELISSVIAVLPHHADPQDVLDIENALDAVQLAGLYDQLARLAEQALRCGADTGLVRCYQAQALIGRKLVLPAIDLLKAAKQRREYARAYERTRINGLLGRCYKQLYEDERAAGSPGGGIDHLRHAINYYALGYLDTFIFAVPQLGDAELEKNVAEWRWVAINLVALLKLARKLGCMPEAAIDPTSVARQIITVCEPRAQSDDPWCAATIAESFVALGELGEAAKWYQRYVDHPRIKPFYIEGSVRQLLNVWEFGPGNPEQMQIIDALKMRQARISSVTLGPAERARWRSLDVASSPVLETILGTSGAVTADLVHAACQRLGAVARIVSRADNDVTKGTGFLVRGDVLHPEWAGRCLVLTSSHVVGTRKSEGSGRRPALSPAQSAVCFDEGPASGKVIPVDLLWESSIAELDTAILALDLQSVGLGSEDLTYCDVLSDNQIPDRWADLTHEHAYLIGHPQGNRLSIALHDNQIVDLGYNDSRRPQHTFVHYKTPTEEGNSGSPVFVSIGKQGGGRSWIVFAIHHMGAPKQGGLLKLNGEEGWNRANEGITLKSIRRQLGEDLEAQRIAAGRVVIPQDVSPHLQAPPIIAPPPRTLPQVLEALENPDVPVSDLAGYFHESAASPVRAFAPNLELRGGIDQRQLEGLEGVQARTQLLDALNKAGQRRSLKEFEKRVGSKPNQPRLLAKGDSWFLYPIRLTATIDHIASTYAVLNLAAAGDTMADMIRDTSFMVELHKRSPHVVLLSAGGNDLLSDGALRDYVREPGAGAAGTGSLLNEKFPSFVDGIVKNYESWIGQIRSAAPHAQCLVHGYDNAFPTRGGHWLGKPLADRAIGSLVQQRAIVNEMVGAYNSRLEALASRLDKVTFVDCRGVCPQREDWYDELHPTSEGYRGVAQRFIAKLAPLL